jgi:hypothetical protein
MMHCMVSNWMMGGMALFGIATLLLIVLAIVALLKYLFVSSVTK